MKQLFEQVIRRDQTKHSWSTGTNPDHRSQSQLMLYKNRINDFFSQTLNSQPGGVLRERVYRYTRDNKISLLHMQELKRIMLALNKDAEDVVSLREFLMRLKQRHFVFPENFLTNLIKDIKLNDTTLSYQKFMVIMNVYCSLPMFKKGEVNNSDSFKNSQDLYGFK